MAPSEEFIEKQSAEQGLIPIVAEEPVTYGYQHENRHMVESFNKGGLPSENWNDGYMIMELMMSSYKSAEEDKTIKYSPENIKGFKPRVAQGNWKP